jgi:hypothetical protein
MIGHVRGNKRNEAELGCQEIKRNDRPHHKRQQETWLLRLPDSFMRKEG